MKVTAEKNEKVAKRSRLHHRIEEIEDEFEKHQQVI